MRHARASAQTPDARSLLRTARQSNARSFVRPRASGSVNAGAMHGKERKRVWTDGRTAESMRCVAASGGKERGGLKGKEANPLVLRSGLPPNRAATAYRPGGGCFCLSLFLASSLSRDRRYRRALGLLAPIPLSPCPLALPLPSLFRSRHERLRRKLYQVHEKKKIRGRPLRAISIFNARFSKFVIIMVHSKRMNWSEKARAIEGK